MLILVTHGSEAGPVAQEALESAAIAAVFGHQVTVAFALDGLDCLSSPPANYSCGELLEMGLQRIVAVNCPDSALPGDDTGSVEKIETHQLADLLRDNCPVLSY